MNIEEQSLGELKRHWDQQRHQALERKERAQEVIAAADREISNAEEKLMHIEALLPGHDESEESQAEPSEGKKALLKQVAADGEAETDHEKVKELVINLLVEIEESERLALKDFMEHVESLGYPTSKGTMHRVLHELVDDELLIKERAEPGSRIRFVYKRNF